MGVESRRQIRINAATLPLYELRERQVILDKDLAVLYGIPTKRLNMYVKRHAARFPEDFAYHVTPEEWLLLQRQMPKRCGRGGRGYRPHAFTEQGVMMVASILNGRRAVAVSIELVRAFVRAREERRHEPSLSALAGTDNPDLFLALLDLDIEFDVGRDGDGLVTYFIQASDTGAIKIGVTQNFRSRFRSLEMSSPVPLRVLGVIESDIEDECHVILHRWRLHGEWFRPAPQVLAFIAERLPTAARAN